MRRLEHARFKVEDSDELVAASLVCRFCLRTAAQLVIDRDDFGGSARCYCPVCAATTNVTMDHDQVLRLALNPPPNIHVNVRTDRDD